LKRKRDYSARYLDAKAKLEGEIRGCEAVMALYDDDDEAAELDPECWHNEARRIELIAALKILDILEGLDSRDVGWMPSAEATLKRVLQVRRIHPWHVVFAKADGRGDYRRVP